MNAMPAKSVYVAGWVIALAAALGVYFGVSRSLSASSGLSEEGGAIVPAVTAVTSAKPILAPTPTMDEAEVRRLAREEAQALLVKPVVHKAPVDDDDSDASAPDAATPPVQTVPLAPAKAAVPVPASPGLNGGGRSIVKIRGST